MNNKLLAGATLLLLTGACRHSEHQVYTNDSVVMHDTTPALVVADTIIYDVIIHNSNPDDAWAAHCLSGLNRGMLIDNIFEMVYSQRAVAFDHETGEKLTIKQVEKMEAGEGFSRDNIGMIQFTEVWYLNPGETTMTKKVLSMVLGYNYYTAQGELIGHKALFRVEL
jgi:hypothetical protein